ncbi:MAG: uncharacterized protein QOJ13_3375 [Gaiellales bacterium]|jgi:predicted TIM-barrel fold metal-dependent hydrolase|nr:uncharacterized protein [Gaiellales bacterium]
MAVARDLADPVAAAAALIEDRHRALIRPLLPPGQPIWDIHAHLGQDADGSLLDPADLLDEMRRFGVERACVFPFRADSLEAYTAQNDAVIETCRLSQGALVPFCRVEPGPGAEAELERALSNGARGIKLHPLTGRFEFSHPIVAASAALAEQHRVPMLLHAGRGIAPFTADLLPLLRRHPGAQVILAHAGCGDFEALAAHAAEHPNMAFDIAVWNLVDVCSLLGRVSPEQILYGTDAPYYGAACVQARLALALRSADAPAEHIRAILWRNAERVVSGRAAEVLSEPLGAPRPAMDFFRLRVHEYLVATFPLVWTKQPDLLGALRLARHAIGEPQTAELQAAADMIDLAHTCWTHELESGSRREVLSLSWTTFRLLEFADALVLCG